MFRRIFSLVFALLFIAGNVFSQVFDISMLSSAKITAAGVTEKYSAPFMRGVTFDPENPLTIKFVIDSADSRGVDKETARLLISYFLAALTVPENDLWVNLSPYESDRIVPNGLSITDMGVNMLAQDYILKQLASSLTHPDTPLGKAYWQVVPSRTLAGEKLNVESFSKVWIVPETADITEESKGTSAYIIKSSLDVMSEKDYSASFQSGVQAEASESEMNGVFSVLLENIKHKVNNGREFSSLRQIYNSLILGIWFKKKFKSTFYRDYFDKNAVKGIDIEDRTISGRIYDLYVEAFKKGTVNAARKETDPATGRIIKRRYFSGGQMLAETSDRLNVIPSADKPVSGKPFSCSSSLFFRTHDRVVSSKLSDRLKILSGLGSLGKVNLSYDAQAAIVELTIDGILTHWFIPRYSKLNVKQISIPEGTVSLYGMENFWVAHSGDRYGAEDSVNRCLISDVNGEVIPLSEDTEESYVRPGDERSAAHGGDHVTVMRYDYAQSRLWLADRTGAIFAYDFSRRCKVLSEFPYSDAFTVIVFDPDGKLYYVTRDLKLKEYDISEDEVSAVYTLRGKKIVSVTEADGRYHTALELYSYEHGDPMVGFELNGQLVLFRDEGLDTAGNVDPGSVASILRSRDGSDNVYRLLNENGASVQTVLYSASEKDHPLPFDKENNIVPQIDISDPDDSAVYDPSESFGGYDAGYNIKINARAAALAKFGTVGIINMSQDKKSALVPVKVGETDSFWFVHEDDAIAVKDTGIKNGIVSDGLNINGHWVVRAKHPDETADSVFIYRDYYLVDCVTGEVTFLSDDGYQTRDAESLFPAGPGISPVPVIQYSNALNRMRLIDRSGNKHEYDLAPGSEIISYNLKADLFLILAHSPEGKLYYVTRSLELKTYDISEQEIDTVYTLNGLKYKSESAGNNFFPGYTAVKRFRLNDSGPAITALGVNGRLVLFGDNGLEFIEPGEAEPVYVAGVFRSREPDGRNVYILKDVNGKPIKTIEFSSSSSLEERMPGGVALRSPGNIIVPYPADEKVADMPVVNSYESVSFTVDDITELSI